MPHAADDGTEDVNAGEARGEEPPAKRAKRRGCRKIVTSPSRTCGSGGCWIALFQKKLNVLETAVAAVAVAAVAMMGERV